MNSPKPSEVQKWQFLRDIPRRYARDANLRRLAAALKLAALGRPGLFAALAQSLVRDGIRYVSDGKRTGGEDIAGFTRGPDAKGALGPLVRGTGDCDDMAPLFVALCLAGGLRARVEPLWRDAPGGAELQHVYGAVEIDSRWLPVELTLARARVGDPPKSVPPERSGEVAEAGSLRGGA